MSHRKPTKTKFNDLWRDEADCLAVTALEPEMSTAWDNVEVGDWEFAPDPQAEVAKQICFGCPVRELCLRDALDDNEAEGIRAGYRFEFGTVSRVTAWKIFNEWGLRARISKKNKTGVVKAEDVESEEMSEMWEND